MVETNLKHPTYKFVDEKEADAIAYAFTEKNKMQKVTVKFPEIKPDEVRAEVTYTGLCHSDVHTVSEEWGPCPFPIVPGHEVVGKVVAVGSDVKDFKVGDKVGFGAQRDCCEKCEYCKMTFDNLCNGQVEQKFTYGDKVWGGYSTLLQQPAKFYFKVPEGLPEEKVPPLFCAGATTYSPIARYAKAGQNVAVLGIGGLGHLAVMYAKAWGCHVTGFTSSKDKEEFIKKLGADKVVVTSLETLKEEEGKYHLVINTLPVDTNMTEMVKLTKPLGHFCQVGLPAHNNPGPFAVGCLVGSHLNFCGSVIGSRKEIQDMLEFSAKHNIVPMCEQFEFKDFEKAYDHLVNGRPKFRCVVNIGGAGPKKS